MNLYVLKDRLHDHFDYSGEINQDHLRKLLGKAVTRKRIEIIGMIKSGKDRPFTTDYYIWTRLEKLSKSRQRENRTELERYANSCRRTLGRTGALGEDGVRQRLAEKYGRSPDLDEVLEEMECDKGYNKKDLKRLRIFKKHIHESDDNDLEEPEMQKCPRESMMEEHSKTAGYNDLRVMSPTSPLKVYANVTKNLFIHT